MTLSNARKSWFPRPDLRWGYLATIPSASRSSADVAIAILAGIAAGAAALAPGEWQLVVIVVCITLFFVLTCPPEIFIAGTIVAAGLYQLGDGGIRFSDSAVSIYIPDVVLVLAALRALSPRARRPPTRPFSPLVICAFAAWFAWMGIAALTGWQEGSPLETVTRLALAPLYLLVGYWAYSRILRERDCDLAQVIRLCAIAVAAFVAWMVAMRILGQTFEQPGANELGEVTTSSGTVLHRDYGFYSAFFLIPLLAVGGLAYVLIERANVWAVAAAVTGFAATLSTLIRGLFLGLALATIALILIAWRAERPNRIKVLAGTAVVGALAFAVLAALNEQIFVGAVERSLPGVLQQSATAVETAQFREHAFANAVAVAQDHPSGLGFVTEGEVFAAGTAPIQLSHSAFGWLLVYTGWIGLALSILAWVALLWSSLVAPCPAPWIKAASIALLLLLLGYSVGVSSIFGQSFVTLPFVVLLALRFTPESNVNADREPPSLR